MRSQIIIIAGIWTGVLFHFLFGSTDTNQTSRTFEEGEMYDSTYISSLSFKIIDSIGDSERWIDMARSIIILREGECLSKKKIEESKNALINSSYFKKVSIEITGENHTSDIIGSTGTHNTSDMIGSTGIQNTSDMIGSTGIHNTSDILISLLPYYLIHTVKISGEFPIFESEIRKILTIHSGKVFIPDELNSQKQLITDFLFKQGFRNSTVSTDVEFFRQKGYCDILIKIQNNQQIRLGKITVSGNNSFSDYRIKRLMATWRNKYIPGASKRFVENEIKADIKKIAAFYRKKNFPDSKVQYQITNDSLKKNTVQLKTIIEEGIRYDFSFSGKRHIQKRQLKKAVSIIQKGNRNEIGLKKCMRNIKKLYAQKGFYEPVITYKDTIKKIRKIEKRFICYNIDAGSRAIIHNIIIEGNRAFSQKKILGLIKSRPRGFLKKGLLFKERLQNDINTLVSLYRDNGYISASVSHKFRWKENKRQVTVVITIQEGLQVLIDSISITGQNNDYTSELLSELTISPRDPFQRDKIQENEIIISRHIGEKGYPNVKVTPDIIFNKEKTGVKVKYSIEEGKLIRTGEVFFRGNFKTKEHILKKKTLLSSGDPFSLIQMIEGQRNIRNMNIFNSVKYKPFGLSEQRDSVTLFIEIDEKKSYSMDLGVGFASNEDILTKIKEKNLHEDIFAKIIVKNLNIAGLNKNLVFNGRVSINEQSAGISFIEPDLWEMPVNASLKLAGERVIKKYFSYWSLGPAIEFQRRIGKNIFSTMSVTYKLRKSFDVKRPQETAVSRGTDSVTIQEKDIPRNILKFSPSINYDTRNSFTRPQKGVYSTINLDISRGLGKSNDDFIKTKFDFRFYLTPFKNLTIATRNQFWHITPYGSIDTLPIDQLFSVGGPLTVRGFRDNIKFSYKKNDKYMGYAAFIGNIEFRIDMGFNFELAFFLDAGGLGNNFFQNRWFGTRFAAGGGLRYNTPIGPVGLMYGFIIDRKKDETKYGALNFSIGYMY